MINTASLLVVNKGILGALAGGIGIAIVAVVMFGAGFFTPPVQPQLPSGDHGGMSPSAMQEVILSLTSINIQEINNEGVTIEVVFDVFNPNKNTMVLEAIEYDLIANGIKLTQSTIGERLQGVVTGTGQTYYVVPNAPLTLKDTVQVRKTELFTPLWIDLENNDVDWNIKGLYIITDPVRMGGQEKDFDFTL
jgi:LEA14-like dessication related protein